MKGRSPSKGNPSTVGQDKLKIIIRIRPILNQEQDQQFVQLEDDNTLQIKRPGMCTYMKFNNILPPTSNQKDVFHLVQDSIREFLNGINMTIFAYGQTGAGKTYSMIGNYSPKDSQENLFNFISSKERGILSRSLEMIMTQTQKKKGVRVFVSFFQIYNQKIFDLYNNNLVPLDIRQSKNGEISIPDLLNVQVLSMEEAIQFLMAGLKNRVTGSTHGNAKSSRSHSIFQINLQRQNQSGEVTYSSLRIVDLAGSEKFKIASDLSAAEKDIRIQELTSINGSLSCLGHCISALIQKSRTHIPFRNSKLTRILSDSLLGQGKMRFIICISPSQSASAETFSTLQFANRAKKAIFERSEMKTPNLSKKKSSENEQIIALKRELEKQKEMRVNLQSQMKKLMSERSDSLVKENTYLRKQNQKLKQQLKQMLVKKQNIKSQSPISSNPHKWSDLSPKLQKQNMSGQDLKAQMLRLPIFQNKGNFETFDSKSDLKSESKSSRIEPLKHKEVRQNVAPYNKKKAEFEKKIRKFIESDSPSQVQGSIIKSSQEGRPQKDQQISRGNNLMRDLNIDKQKSSPSFNNKQSAVERSKRNLQNIYQEFSSWGDKQKDKDYQSSQILTQNNFHWQEERQKHKSRLVQQSENVQPDEEWMDNEDTQQLIQQACEKMNLPDFKDLKCEMDRAKQQLIFLKQRDDQISKRKQLDIGY